MSKKIRFAVIGVGHIGKRHAEMINKNTNATLVALVDVKNKSELNIEDNNIPFFSSLSDFLNSNIEADVINIATPNGLHVKQALQCLEKNLHVVIEKPIALNIRDAALLITEATKRNLYVFPVLQNRYSPASVWLKELMESNILGKIFIVQLNCYWNRDKHYYEKGSWHGDKDLDGGTLFTQFSHFIDIMYWLLGGIKNIRGKLADFNHGELTDFEDSGIINFDFIREGMGSINYSTSVWDKNMESSMLIIAENGTVKIGGQYMDKIDYCHIKNYTMPVLSNTIQNDYGKYKGSAANHHFIIENVINVLNGNAIITTTALEALNVIEIIQSIYSSIEESE